MSNSPFPHGDRSAEGGGASLTVVLVSDSDVSADHFLLVPPSCTSSPFLEMPRPHEANTCQMGNVLFSRKV